MGFTSALLRGEFRAHPSRYDNPALYGLDVLNESHTGINVTEDSALHSTAVWAAVKIIAETIGSLPLFLFKRLPRGKEKALNHYQYNLLHLQPNTEIAAINFRETIVGQCILYGNAYAEIEYNDTGYQVANLWPLNAKRVTIHRSGGQIFYTYILDESGKTVIYPKWKVLHIATLSPDGLIGYNPTDKGREAIGLNLALEEYAARFFGNGAKPPIVLEHPGVLGEKSRDNLKKSWSNAHQGLSKAHRMAILEEGMKLHEYGMSPEDSQAIEARHFSVIEVARLTNLPPHFLKDLTHGTYSNIEHQDLEFVKYTLRPWLVRLEQNYNLQLLTEKERKKYFYEHLIDGLLRGDVKSRWEAYSMGFQTGVWSPNEIREMENRNPYDGGDQRFVQVNMAPVDQIMNIMGGKEEDNRFLESRARIPVERDRLQEVYYPLFKGAAEKIVNRESIAIQRAIKKHLKTRTISSFNDWIENFYGDLPKHIKREFQPVIVSYAEQVHEAAAREIGETVPLTDTFRAFVTDYLERYSERHIERSVGQLNALIKEHAYSETFTDVLEERTTEWSDTRADKIADEEVKRLSGAVAMTVFLGAGYASYWRNRGKSCLYCKELEGKRIRSELESFVAAGDEVSPEGQPPMKVYGMKKHPPLHQGCDCFISPY